MGRAEQAQGNAPPKYLNNNCLVVITIILIILILLPLLLGILYF